MTTPAALHRVYRSPWSIVGASVWAVVAVVVVGDLVRRGMLATSLRALGVVVAISLSVWVVLIRPCVVADVGALTLRNVVRDVRLPWARIENVSAPLTLTVRSDDGRDWRSWAISASSRPRRSLTAQRPLYGTREAVAGQRELPADAVVRELLEARSVLPGSPDEAVTVRVAWEAVVPLAVAAVLLALAWVTS